MTQRPFDLLAAEIEGALRRLEQGYGLAVEMAAELRRADDPETPAAMLAELMRSQAALERAAAKGVSMLEAARRISVH